MCYEIVCELLKVCRSVVKVTFIAHPQSSISRQRGFNLELVYSKQQLERINYKELAEVSEKTIN